MRTLFIPLAKLFGLYAVFRPLFYIAYMVFILFIRSDAKQESLGSVFIFSGIQAVGILLALLLLFKTGKIADILKIPQDRADSIVIDSSSILRIGLILIGVSAILYALPTLISTIIFLAQDYVKMSWSIQEKLWNSISKVVLGCLLLILATPLARFLNKGKGEGEDDN